MSSNTMSRFEVEENGETAYLEFELDNAGWITLWHTEVPPSVTRPRYRWDAGANGARIRPG